MNTNKREAGGRLPHLRSRRPHSAIWLSILLIFSGCASSVKTSGGELAVRLDEVLHRMDGKGAVVGARVLDLSSGNELYASSADRPMIPASNLKVTVSSAALDRFGPEYRFKTYLAVDGDDLWLIGTGDPAVGDPKIAAKAGGLPTTFMD